MKCDMYLNKKTYTNKESDMIDTYKYYSALKASKKKLNNALNIRKHQCQLTLC